MDPALKTLKATLEAIRDTTMNALAQIGQSRRNIRCGGNAKRAGI
jgi:hypothetical protein